MVEKLKDTNISYSERDSIAQSIADMISLAGGSASKYTIKEFATAAAINMPIITASYDRNGDHKVDSNDLLIEAGLQN